MSVDETKLPLRSPSVEDIRTIAALTRRSIDDPLIDGSDLQRRWLDIMRRYPGKNSDEIAADFLDALAGEREQADGRITIDAKMLLRANEALARWFGGFDNATAVLRTGAASLGTDCMREVLEAALSG